MGKFVSNSSSDGKLLTNGEIDDKGVLVCSSDVITNCDYKIISAGSYIDDMVCEELKKLGIKMVWLMPRDIIDVSPCYCEMFKWHNGIGKILLREDMDIGVIKANEYFRTKFIVPRGKWVCEAIRNVCQTNDVWFNFHIIDAGFFVDSLYDVELKWDFWGELQNPLGELYNAGVKSDVRESYLEVVTSITIDIRVFRCWKKRIVQDGIRKRDIPGFERELIELGLEHLL